MMTTMTANVSIYTSDWGDSLKRRSRVQYQREKGMLTAEQVKEEAIYITGP